MVKDLWWQWVNALKLVAGSSRSRLPLPPPQYRRLHAELLRALLEEAARADGEQRDFLLDLIAWVRPWLTLDAVLQTDPQILADLISRCEEVGVRLGNPPRRPLSWKWPAAVLLAILIVSLGVFTDFGTEWAGTWSAEATRVLRRAILSPYWIVGALVLAAAIFALWPIKRN